MLRRTSDPCRVEGPRRAPIATDSRHSHAIAPNLPDRNFDPDFSVRPDGA